MCSFAIMWYLCTCARWCVCVFLCLCSCSCGRFTYHTNTFASNESVPLARTDTRTHTQTTNRHTHRHIYGKYSHTTGYNVSTLHYSFSFYIFNWLIFRVGYFSAIYLLILWFSHDKPSFWLFSSFVLSFPRSVSLLLCFTSSVCALLSSLLFFNSACFSM